MNNIIPVTHLGATMGRGQSHDTSPVQFHTVMTTIEVMNLVTSHRTPVAELSDPVILVRNKIVQTDDKTTRKYIVGSLSFTPHYNKPWHPA